ncbi:MAG: hypothetical protein RJA76_1430 [Bacteroidota bacterium]|jgi:uncharacterized membrane protein
MRLLLASLILLIPLGYAYYLLPGLPDQIPTHFGIDGKPDAWGGKNSIFLAPGILGGVGFFLFNLFQNLGKVDPKFKETPENTSIFKSLSYGITAFLSILALLIVESTANTDFHFEYYIFSFIGLSFALFGKYMGKLKPNYFAGFRLPWTLEDPANWKYTHETAGTYWFYCGLLQTVFCAILPTKWSFLFFMSNLMVQIFVPIIFSYNFYRKNKN